MKNIIIPAPEGQSQLERMLKVLKSRRWINSRDFIYVHRITTKPSTRIGELRELGHTIEVERREKGSRFVSYRLIA